MFNEKIRDANVNENDVLVEGLESRLKMQKLWNKSD